MVQAAAAVSYGSFRISPRVQETLMSLAQGELKTKEHPLHTAAFWSSLAPGLHCMAHNGEEARDEGEQRANDGMKDEWQHADDALQHEGYINIPANAWRAAIAEQIVTGKV